MYAHGRDFSDMPDNAKTWNFLIIPQNIFIILFFVIFYFMDFFIVNPLGLGPSLQEIAYFYFNEGLYGHQLAPHFNLKEARWDGLVFFLMIF